MRKKLIVFCLAVLAASLAAGCGNDDNNGPGGPGAISREQAEKGLDMFHFENAPTLGPIARKFQLAMTLREWGEMWDVIADTNHKFYEQQYERDKKNIDQQIKGDEELISKTSDENTRKALQDNVEKLKKIKAQLPNVHNGKEYFILWMDVMFAVSSTEVKPPIQTGGKVEQDMAVVSGEKFSADHKTGWIVMKTVKSNRESEWYHFINEGGQWKLNWGGHGD